jgi:hypothetical protein
MGGNAELLFVDLSSLQIVLGDYLFGHFSPKLMSCELPELLSVPEGRLEFQGTGLTRFYAPKLTFVNGFTELYSNPSMTAIIMPMLTMTGHHLSMGGNAELLFVDLSSLQIVLGDYLFSGDTPKLMSCELPELLSVPEGSMRFFNNKLTRFYAPKLTRVGLYLTISDNPSMTLITLTSLVFVGGDFTLLGNTMLTTLSIPALATVTGNVYICNNGALPLPILAESVRMTAQCAFSMSGGCSPLATCPSL